MNQEIISLLKAALECSIYINPCDPGLTFQELFEIGKRAGYLEGEINDSMRFVTAFRFGSGKLLLPSEQDTSSWVFFFHEENDYRNFSAFDFVYDELNLLTRSEGAGRAAIERSVLIERGVKRGIDRHAAEVAITYSLLSKQLTVKDNLLRFSNPGIKALPSTQMIAHGQPHRTPHRAKAYPLVKDAVNRRSDGRLPHAEPLDAFAVELERLGYRQFRMWWTQTISELNLCGSNSTPVAVSVLAAALVEGALTFIVKHARTRGQFQSKDYEKDPRSWKIDDLVASAASGGSDAILPLQVRTRAETLIKTRQRIHAGRMLSEFPGGPPDIRPDEARDAKATAEQVVRSILDWLQKDRVS